MELAGKDEGFLQMVISTKETLRITHITDKESTGGPMVKAIPACGKTTINMEKAHLSMRTVKATLGISSMINDKETVSNFTRMATKKRVCG